MLISIPKKIFEKENGVHFENFLIHLSYGKKKCVREQKTAKPKNKPSRERHVRMHA